MRKLIENHPNFQQIVEALRSGIPHRKVAAMYDVNENTLGSWSQRHRDLLVTDLDDQLGEAKQLIAKAADQGLTVSSVSIKDKDFGSVTARVTVKPPRPEVRQAQPVNVTVKNPPKRPKQTDGRKWAVVLPDAQRPFVDHRAVDISFQIVRDMQARHGVDTIIHLGDDLDLPDFSKHRSAPQHLGRLQEAIDDQYRALAVERALAPDAKIVWLEGNHEARLINSMVDLGLPLVGLTRAGEPSKPVVDVPFLCRLDELGVEYVAPFPEGEYWLNDHLRFVHGDIVKSGKGQTAAAYLAQGQASTIYGHIHRFELVSQTRQTRKGPRTYIAGSPGAFCRTDGAVPSAKSGITGAGKPGHRRSEDWQNGMFIVSYETAGAQQFHVEPVLMFGGSAHWRGVLYTATVDIDGNPLS